MCSFMYCSWAFLHCLLEIHTYRVGQVILLQLVCFSTFKLGGGTLCCALSWYNWHNHCLNGKCEKVKTGSCKYTHFWHSENMATEVYLCQKQHQHLSHVLATCWNVPDRTAMWVIPNQRHVCSTWYIKYARESSCSCSAIGNSTDFHLSVKILILIRSDRCVVTSTNDQHPNRCLNKGYLYGICLMRQYS